MDIAKAHLCFKTCWVLTIKDVSTFKGRYYKKKTLINTHVENSNTTNSITRFILNQFEHILLHRALVVQQFHVFFYPYVT